METSALAKLLQALSGIAITYVLWASFRAPLRKIPGPFIAKWTNLWRLKSVLGRHTEVEQRRLHDKLGPVVRLGPNMVSIADPDMINPIYSRKNILIKGDFYKCFDLNVNGQRVEHPFSTRNEQMNTEALKPIAPHFAMGSILKLELQIDSTIECLLEQLETRFVKTGRSCDIDNWLHFCAYDVIGELTWSKRLGFLDNGKDVIGIAQINRSAHNYLSAVGMMPWLDYLMERNPIIRIGPPSYGAAVGVMAQIIAARISGKDGHDKTSKPDMLDGFIEAADSQDKIMSNLFANVAAGSDTVATSLKSIIYHLCKPPDAMRKVQQELEQAQLSAPVSWSDCQKLPYLGAVAMEACRITPGVGLPLERRVGAAGLALPDGKTVLPPGTLVGINPYVINRDKDVFGADSDVFRPERWLQGDHESLEGYQERVRRMKATDLTFGAGKRVCLGRNVALMEMHKISASLLCTFDVELVDPGKEWRTHNAWLMFESGIDVRLTRRGMGARFQ